METDGVTVGEATVDEERSEKQTKTVLRLVRYHGVGSVHESKHSHHSEINMNLQNE